MTSDNHLLTRLLKIGALCTCIVATSAACATAGANADADKTGASQTYHWYDGDHKRSVRIAPEFVANFGKKEVLRQAGSQKEASAGDSPVFVDTRSAGAMRALPGGVIIRVRRVMNQAEVNSLLKPFETDVVRPIGSAGKTWLVRADAGLPSLNLANTIYESGLVQSASPNWWQERTRK